MGDTLGHLETGVSIPSVNNGINYSVNEERKIQECIADSLTKFGLKVDKWAKIRML
jgi:acetylornithine deacetylase/succinyl-diaminopimelate desuccinylase-like protein